MSVITENIMNRPVRLLVQFRSQGLSSQHKTQVPSPKLLTCKYTFPVTTAWHVFKDVTRCGCTEYSATDAFKWSRPAWSLCQWLTTRTQVCRNHQVTKIYTMFNINVLQIIFIW